MTVWSWSRLSLHDQRPRRYWHRYIDCSKSLVLPTSADLYFGLRLHEAMRHIYERQRDGIVPTVEEVVARFRQQWEALRPTGERKLEFRANGVDEAESIALGARAIREFLRTKSPFEADQTVDLEVNLSVVLDPDGTRLNGRLDRIAVAPDGRWIVVDYKTTGRLPRRDDLEKDGQLALYALAVQAAWPAAETIELRWEFLRFGGADSIRATPAMLDDVRQRILGRIRAIEARGRDGAGFKIRPGPLCGTCQFQHCCEGGRHAYEMRINGRAAPAMRTAADLVDKWVEADQERKAATTVLTGIEERIDNIKLSLITIADAENLAVIRGGAAEARITRTDRLIPPRKTYEPEAAASLEAALRTSPWWGEVSCLDRRRALALMAEATSGASGVRVALSTAAVREVKTKLTLVRKTRSC